MELDYLYNVTEKENIRIYNSKIDDVCGAFINVKNINAIVLNYDNIKTKSQEKCVLSEELGHYYMDATYSLYCTDKTYISRQEYRAKKWSYYMLIPFENLKSAILNRYQYTL